MKTIIKFTLISAFIQLSAAPILHAEEPVCEHGRQWWLKSGPIVRLSLVRDRCTIRDYIGMLPALAREGFKVIDLYAPYHGGVEYGGLDAIDYYSVRRGAGSFDDIRELIRNAHDLDMKVITFLNLGYSSQSHPDFIQACTDVKNGVRSPQSDMFVWADALYRMDRPLAPHFQQDNSNDGGWVFSEAAGKYYYSRWFGTGGNSKLPQYWFGAEVWRDECARIVRFWRDMGFDGFIIDAVNWYTGCDWVINNDVIVGPASEKGSLFLQPEGAGGNKDEPVAWITEGGYNCLQDYSLAAWWFGTDVIGDCIESGDASSLWPVLESYRNRIVEAGGVTYMGLGQGGGIRRTADQLLFETALLTAIGQIINFNLTSWKNLGNARLTEIFNLQTGYCALAPAAGRELIEKDGMPSSIFALRCLDGANEENIDAIFNFGSEDYLYDTAGINVRVAPLGCVFIQSGREVLYRTPEH